MAGPERLLIQRVPEAHNIHPRQRQFNDLVRAVLNGLLYDGTITQDGVGTFSVPQTLLGRPGVQGLPGANGRDGTRILTGIGDPPSSRGRVGDLYLDRLGKMVWEKQEILFGMAPRWVEVMSLAGGPPGPAGQDGRDGADGPPGPAGRDGVDGADSSDSSVLATVFPFTPIVNGDFSDHNAPTVVVTEDGVFVSTASAAGNENRARVKAVPGATPYSVEIAFIPRFIEEQFHGCGFYVTNGTAMIGFYVSSETGTTHIKVDKWTNATTFSANALNLRFAPFGPVVWLKYRDDGVNRLLSWGSDGVNYEQVFSEARTTFLTATHWGFGVQTAVAARGTAGTFLSWKEGT